MTPSQPTLNGAQGPDAAQHVLITALEAGTCESGTSSVHGGSSTLGPEWAEPHKSAQASPAAPQLWAKKEEAEGLWKMTEQRAPWACPHPCCCVQPFPAQGSVATVLSLDLASVSLWTSTQEQLETV